MQQAKKCKGGLQNSEESTYQNRYAPLNLLASGLIHSNSLKLN